MTLPWNFVLTGPERAGVGAIVTALRHTANVTCHVDLMHPERGSSLHTKYFGTSPSAAQPGVLPYDPKDVSPWHYLNVVMATPRRQETAIGVYIPYADMCRLDLFDYLTTREAEGSFGVVHVTRSPLVCYVSKTQRETQRLDVNNKPAPIRVDAAALVDYWRWHDACAAKIKAACRDQYELAYESLLVDPQGTIAKLRDFIEQPASPTHFPCGQRDANYAIDRRVMNWPELLAALPHDYRCRAAELDHV